MDTQETVKTQDEEIELVDTTTVTEEKRDVVIEVTGFSLFGDVKL